MPHQRTNSNSAGGPLPILPRRTSSSRTTNVKRVSKFANDGHRSKRSSSASSESDSNTGSTTSPVAPLSLRARRSRGPNPPTFPDALSTTPLAPFSGPSSLGCLRASKTEGDIAPAEKKGSTRPMLYVPGMSLRVALDRPDPKDRSKSTPCRAADDTRLVCKKSGQLVKSSLKPSRSAGSDGFSAFAGSKSEPATPVCKAVKFDSQLEHVKLFLAEQKPLAVSCGGSPTDDTSGTDSDFPSFIFGDDDPQCKRRKLAIDVVNMPPRINPHANVVLEKLSISTDNSSIVGQVRVRNIAYAKLVAIRFTFDFWQTTSEVTARYIESIGPEFDRFEFAIKLTDLLARIEEKTLIFAVKYAVAGQEHWDNNGGLNYVAKFVKSYRNRSLSDEEHSSSNLASLQNKLEKVVEGKERSGPAFLAQNAKVVSSEHDDDAPNFKSPSLASRYDFSASLKVPWKYQETPPSHLRTNSFPQFAKAAPLHSAPLSKPKPSSPTPTTSTTSSAKPPLPLGSPREPTDAIPVTSPSMTATPFSIPSRPPTQTRNHRRGYFDTTTFNATNVRRTPPTSPPTLYIPDRVGTIDSLDLNLTDGTEFGTKLSSFLTDQPPQSAPPVLSRISTTGLSLPSLSFGAMSDAGFDSEVPTPTLVTPSSSRDTTPSPTETFAELPSSGSDSDGPRNPDTLHYRDLINQYCFFTGDPTDSDSVQATVPSKTPGLYDFAGSLRSALSSSPSDPTNKFLPLSRVAATTAIPQRSSSADDIISLRSGSITPTTSQPDTSIHSMSDPESRSSTPVPFVV